MTRATWAARVKRREVCQACRDPPLPGRSSCQHHLERNRMRKASQHDPLIVVPPPRPRRRLEELAQIDCVTGGATERRRRENRRFARGMCVQCEDKLEAGSTKRRCGPCREYNAEKSRESYQREKLRREANPPLVPPALAADVQPNSEVRERGAEDVTDRDGGEHRADPPLNRGAHRRRSAA